MSNLRHLRLIGGVHADAYRPHPRPITQPVFLLPARPNPRAHASSVRAQLLSASHAGADELALNASKASGLNFTFESKKGFPLKVESLEDRTLGMTVCVTTTARGIQRATVFVPRGSIQVFLRKIRRYEIHLRKPDKKGDRKRKHKELIESIEVARLTVAQDLWSDDRPFPTSPAQVWWEVWLRLDDATAVDPVSSFRSEANALGLEVSPRQLIFPERVVVLLKARPTDWRQSRLLLGHVAELRLPAEATTPYLDLTPKDQQEAVSELVQRVTPSQPGAPVVCVLDAGVMHEHPLLKASLPSSDCHALEREWGTTSHDDLQHGTLMAGNSLYGCLTTVLPSQEPITLSHRLESVKVLSPNRAVAQELYGEVMLRAVETAEAASGKRRRVVCAALTDKKQRRTDGDPTAWSSAIDLLAWNNGQDTRLACIAAGNLGDSLLSSQYTNPASNHLADATIEDPAQSWNALTVGAFTDRMHDANLGARRPLAARGGLCPASRTSVGWRTPKANRSSWPYKPDLVMEGGNWVGGEGLTDRLFDTQLLTTALHKSGRLLDHNGATSGATALAARACAMIWAAYPTLRAESVRALLIHSARWRPQMMKDCPGDRSKAVTRLRTFGYGVPDVERAISSAKNNVWMIGEHALQPFEKGKDGSVQPKQMAIHELPWPVDVLERLGATKVSLRVTLSYFIEPSPGQRGWTESFRFGSHGYRFDLKPSTMDLPTFKSSLSAAIASDGESVSAPKPEDSAWALGEQMRCRGCLHSDWWTGPAHLLAKRNALAVRPVTGWWRERPYLGRLESIGRYSLVLSLSTDADIDLYQAIAVSSKIVVPIDV